MNSLYRAIFFIKPFLFFVCVAVGVLLGRGLIHRCLLQPKLDMFDRDKGLWLVAGGTAVFTVMGGAFGYNLDGGRCGRANGSNGGCMGGVFEEANRGGSEGGVGGGGG